ncbi:hypothetical protein SH528x_003201 [Novipirellula sp. SH528]|uniref:hypothetical protein n=1 Tax=Novipirellula sp. SH528 TaxID=3454466 RepID=UPI003F9F8A2C
MTQDENYCSSRELHGPGGLRVSVPYRPQREPSDMQRDFPPYNPVLVWLDSYEWDYASVVRERGFRRDDGDRMLTDSQIDWLIDQDPTIRKMRDERRTESE